MKRSDDTENDDNYREMARRTGQFSQYVLTEGTEALPAPDPSERAPATGRQKSLPMPRANRRPFLAKADFKSLHDLLLVDDTAAFISSGGSLPVPTEA